MTSRERLIAAARRDEVDTIPVSPRLGVAVTQHCGNAGNAARLRLRGIYDYDPHFDIPGNVLPFANPFETFRGSPGVDVRFDVCDQGALRKVDRTICTPSGDLHDAILVPNPGRSEYGANPNPTWTERLVKGEEDLAELEHLMPSTCPDLADEYHNWEAVVGDGGLVRATLYGALDHQAGEVIKIEELMMSYLTNRDFALRLVEMFWIQIKAQTKALCEAGVRVFFLPYYWHSLSVGWSPAIFEEWFLPMIAEQVGLIHSYDGLAFYYDDGKIRDILPFLVRAGVDVVETCVPPPVGDFDLADAKVRYGAAITFMGCVDLIYTLQKGDVGDVERAVAEVCAVGGGDDRRGIILGTSDSMREGTSKANIDAYFLCGRRYGGPGR